MIYFKSIKKAVRRNSTKIKGYIFAIKKRHFLVFKENRLAQIVAIVFLSIFLALVLVECSLRTYYWASNNMILGLTPKRTTLSFYDNDIIGHMLVPNQNEWFVPHTKEYYTKVEVNSHGWPDSEHNFKKDENTVRILFLGDSFVESTQVSLQNRFFKQFEREMQKIATKKIEVIAMGRGNTGTAVQYLMLKNYGLLYKPDMVVHMFLTANDVKNNSPVLQNDPYLPYFELDGSGNLKEIPHIKREQRGNANIKEVFKKFRLVELLLSVRQSIIERKDNTKIGGYPVDYHIYDQNASPEFEKAWLVTKKLILETKKTAEEGGAKYILITLSNNEQVNLPVRERILKTYPEFKINAIDFEKPDREIKKFCEGEDIECFHMLPFFKEYASSHKSEPTHYYYEGHWNQLGNNLAAEFMVKNLSGLLDN